MLDNSYHFLLIFLSSLLRIKHTKLLLHLYGITPDSNALHHFPLFYLHSIILNFSLYVVPLMLDAVYLLPFFFLTLCAYITGVLFFFKKKKSSSSSSTLIIVNGSLCDLPMDS